MRSEVQLLPGPFLRAILAIIFPVARIAFCDVGDVCPFPVPVGAFFGASVERQQRRALCRFARLLIHRDDGML